MEITILGTSSMVPTKERNVQSIFLSHKAEGILIDCGEGTQRQMNIAGINRNRVTRILISHWHGDHVSGLIGLLLTIGNSSEGKKVHLYAPEGSKKHVDAMRKMCFFYEKIDLEIHELNPKQQEKLKFFENEDFELYAVKLEHSIPCLGFRFQEKDRYRMDKKKLEKKGLKGAVVGKLEREHKVLHNGETIRIGDVASLRKGRSAAFILDTVLCDSCYMIAEDADILISEATYGGALIDKAESYKHMTVKDATTIANTARVKKLVLTHFSQRYKTTTELEEEARTYFTNTRCAHDFMRIKV